MKNRQPASFLSSWAGGKGFDRNLEKPRVNLVEDEGRCGYNGGMDEQFALELEGVDFKYKDYQDNGFCPPVFEGLELKVRRGEKRLILGAPNAGKTTLCNLVVGSVPKYLGGELKGRIEVMGQDLAGCQTWDLADVVFHAAQNSEEQLVCSCPEDEVAFGLQMLGLERDVMLGKVRAALEDFGLWEKRQMSSENLSGGEKKRLLLAVARALDPQVYLLDETFDELDEGYKAKLADWIRNTGKTVVLLCSRPLDIYRGLFDSWQIMENGTLRDVGEDEVFCGQSVEFEAFSSCSGGAVQLRARDVTVKKGNEFHVHVQDFHLGMGEVVALSGPNGSGKSSFARTLCGLDEAAGGEFRLLDSSADDGVKTGNIIEKAERLVKVGYLFQNPDFQIFLTTVRDELEYPARTREKKAQKAEAVDEACRLFGLKADSVASMLSYPERKKLQGAVYYLLDRRFCILDEMESALGYEECHRIIGLLRRNGAGILVISHDPKITAWTQRRYVITDGEMREVRDEH